MGKKAQHFWIEPDDLARKGIDFCSLEAQGLWLKVMRLLHASERYGYFSRDGKPVSDEQSARRCGIDVTKWVALLAELLEFDLLKRSADGILYSPELIAQAEWRVKEAKRQKDFQDKKRAEKQKTNGETNGKYNSEYNGYITPDITEVSRPNYNKNSFSSSDEKEKEKGGGGGGVSNSRARGNGKPPPAAAAFSSDDSKSKTEQRLDELQAKYQQLDVRRVREKYLKWCRDNSKEPKWQIFEKNWLETEFEPMEAGQDTKPNQQTDRRAAIDACKKCDKNGYVMVGDGVKICKHEENQEATA